MKITQLKRETNAIPTTRLIRCLFGLRISPKFLISLELGNKFLDDQSGEVLRETDSNIPDA